MVPALIVAADYRPRTWGGWRLAPPGDEPIGEAWIAGPGSLVSSGAFAGRTLDDLAADLGPDLVGSAATNPGRFPLLLKLLDTASWLSVQVHPDDATAGRLAGPGAVGKTEAWYVLEADPGAELVAGVRPGEDAGAIRTLIRQGDASLQERLARHQVRAGDALLVEAGTLHTIGPGLLIYELQQPSDITYRVYDWGRPTTAGRKLHHAEAEASVDPAAAVAILHPAPAAGPTTVLRCLHFALDLVDLAGGALRLDPAGRSVHCLTVAEGRVTVSGGGSGDPWRFERGRLETLVVPAGAGMYEIAASGTARVLLARLP
ncbi:MAG: class I mannose-6-phosphate isomerase [Chloroflexi bacterium]|nr:class I mannose-6-phosphate isomerase [Chloroflexota bacterium]